MTEPLTAQQEQVWRALARLIVTLPRALSSDLHDSVGLSLTQYTVLMFLSEAPDQRLRISELADKVAVSQAQTSRLVDSMTRGGLINRLQSDLDRRSRIAELTDRGRDLLAEAWPVHLASTRRLVVDHLDPAVLDDFGRVVESMAQASEAAARAAGS
ncbi:MarR family winged helix-turn-helix transcriptional regulator [Williamsia sterculiae]|uniref:Transcriptional regulator, MarR family n=1 Tax=Williamsia sterculiae TaxID=1344003 RepID=A0A1N7FJ03_9NOCA|nr:MarR family transcriptional regulator [Williamsia sterculiae]SIS00264.1 transcriptional regulator, MarR family [Williamsia sterculiae]